MAQEHRCDEGLSATQAQVMKDYLNGKLLPKEAASELLKNVDIQIS